MRWTGLIVAASLLGVAGCTTAPQGGSAGLLGLTMGVGPAESARIARRVADKPLGSAANPVRADMPPGQRAYLSRLRCADGKAPAFHRIGSMGDGPYGSIMDAYQLACAGSSPAEAVVHMDMYHPGHVEAAAVPGFTIIP